MLLPLAITQQTLAQECSRKGIDEVLDGPLKLVDICSTVKDWQLVSVVRRRRVAETGFIRVENAWHVGRKLKSDLERP